MKNPVEYIKKELERFTSMFPNASIRYAFESVSDYHVVEIEPYEELKMDSNFLDWAMKFWREFEEEFASENLLISERDEMLNDMSNLLYEHSSNRRLNVSAIEKFNIESLQVHFDCNIFDSQYLAA